MLFVLISYLSHFDFLILKKRTQFIVLDLIIRVHHVKIQFSQRSMGNGAKITGPKFILD